MELNIEMEGVSLLNKIIKRCCYIAIALVISFWGLGFSQALAYGNSEYEFNHIYPRANDKYGSVGDPYTIEIKEFEHRWLHNSGGFDSDWNKVFEDVPTIWEWFGNPQFYDADGVTMYSKRNAAVITGGRVISYTVFVYNFGNKSKSGLLATHFDGVSNVLYNTSYIISIPAKFVHFSLECFKRGTGIFNGNREVYGVDTAVEMFLWMCWELFSGFFLAIIGWVLGIFLGAIFHPLQTLGNLTFSFSGVSDAFMNNLLVSIFDFVSAVVKPLWHILFW